MYQPFSAGFVNDTLGFFVGCFPFLRGLRIANVADGASECSHSAAISFCLDRIGLVTLERLLAPCQEETPFTNYVVFCIYPNTILSVSRRQN